MCVPRLATLKCRALAFAESDVAGTLLPDVSVIVEHSPSGPIHCVYRPSLCLVLQGAKVSQLGALRYRYDDGKCLITSLEVPIRAEIVAATACAPYIALVVDIDPAMVAELLLEQVETGASAEQVPAALSVHPLPNDLVDPLERLIALAEAPRDIPVLAPMIRREIVWRLLNGPYAQQLRQSGLADSRFTRIARAIAWLRENYAETISVSELALRAGMSPATFHRHFKSATAMTPGQFQKTLRLQEARRLLLLEGGDVAQIGFAVGYESPSQFSREYRRMFGAPPGKDGTELRRAMAG